MSIRREQEIRVSFRATDADAREILSAIKLTVLALTDPTKENASALFELGAAAIVTAVRP